MHPDLARLIDLQSHDDELRREHDHIAGLAKSLAAAESRAKAADSQLAQLRESISKEEALRRREESDIADLRQKLGRDQKKMDMANLLRVRPARVGPAISASDCARAARPDKAR